MTLKSTIFLKCLRTLYKINTNKTNDVHTALIEALYSVFIDLRDDINQANLEMCLKTATGVWLDAWGEYFNVPRETNEPDQYYADRIIADVIEPKVTISALKRATARYLNRKHGDSWKPDDIILFEPWTGLMKLSHRGTLSETARLWSPEYWTHCVLDLTLPDATELTSELIAYLNTVKAAGVKIIWSITAGDWDVVTEYFEWDSVKSENNLEFHLEVNPKYNIEGFRTNDGTRITYQPEGLLQETFTSLANKSGGNPDSVTIKNVSDYIKNTYTHLIDSLYNSSLSGDKDCRQCKLSGNYTIWKQYSRTHWFDSPEQHSIRDYRDSETVRLSDYEYMFQKSLEEITIQDFYDLEFHDRIMEDHTLINTLNSTVHDTVSFYPDTTKSTVLVGEINELDEQYADGLVPIPGTDLTHKSTEQGILSYSQGLFQYQQLDNYAKYYPQLPDVLTIQIAQDTLGEETTVEDIENNKTVLVKALIAMGLIIPIPFKGGRGTNGNTGESS